MSPATADLDALLRRLMMTPPAEFVAERNRLVKELRAGGDADSSAAVGQLRRPSLADWALNLAAAESADAVADLVDAAEAMATAQEAAMAGQDAGGLRVAMPTLRERTATVAGVAAAIAVREGHTGVGSSPADLGARITQLAGVPAAMALLRRGLLGVEDPDLVDPFGGDDPAPASRPAAARRRSSAKTMPPSKAVAAKADTKVDDELAVRRAAAKARQRTAAEATLAAAERAVTKRESAVAAARLVVLEAEDRLAAANADLELAVVDLAAAEQRRDQAATDVEDLEH